MIICKRLFFISTIKRINRKVSLTFYIILNRISKPTITLMKKNKTLNLVYLSLKNLSVSL
jgi:hypothetical protein